ncbi:hypothetical protein LPJ55_002302 [Coemansia sp. RSA 990]|nr:hypothetical protein LPJ68_003033 [Coemansia sp. RSA 1086]KAJ1751511.1 hypothetical protein LPJ79_001989 [Coemansia sp. RSA 1821]KAJ1873447.1 hypothetical protein LPJ55_002302 [Coemansia sp. RSA 990]KAJ2670037.1 hypothetical protein IWW42_004237 [Coemansia sp. RSA 1085]
MSAYTATSSEALAKYCQQVPNVIVFFFNTDAPNAQEIRKHLKPLLKTAKQMDYGCVQVNAQHIGNLRKTYHIKSTEGAIFFAHQKYIKHYEHIDNRIFLSDAKVEHKPDAADSDSSQSAQLPMYPPIKPDDVVDLKPDEITPAYKCMKPDEVAPVHSASLQTPALPDMALQKPNLAENDGYSEAYKQYIYHKPLPQAPASSQANQPQVDNCTCTIL